MGQLEGYLAELFEVLTLDVLEDLVGEKDCRDLSEVHLHLLAIVGLYQLAENFDVSVCFEDVPNRLVD